MKNQKAREMQTLFSFYFKTEERDRNSITSRNMRKLSRKETDFAAFKWFQRTGTSRRRNPA